MTDWSFVINGRIAAGCLAFDQPSNTLWFATDAGEIRTLRLMDGREMLAGSGYQSPVGLVLDGSGLGLTVVEAAGLVWNAVRREANRGAASQKVDLGEMVIGAAPGLYGQGVAIITTAGRLVMVDQQTGAVEPWVDGFSKPLGLSLDLASNILVVFQDGAPSRSVVSVDANGNKGTPINVPVDTSAVLSAPLSGSPAVLVSSGAGQLTLVDLTGGPEIAGPLLGDPVRGLARWQSLVLVVTANSVNAIEWGLDAGTLPISMPIAPLFVTGYARAEVDFASQGLVRDDIEFVVDEGLGCGICLSRH